MMTNIIQENIFTGKTIVATGKFMNYTRNGINEKITSLGAKAGSSVTGKTDFLMCPYCAKELLKKLLKKWL